MRTSAHLLILCTILPYIFSSISYSQIVSSSSKRGKTTSPRSSKLMVLTDSVAIIIPLFFTSSILIHSFLILSESSLEILLSLNRLLIICSIF